MFRKGSIILGGLRANATEATLSEGVGATLDAGKRDLRRFACSLPPELIMQPLIRTFLAVSYEQQRPSDPEQQIGIFFIAGADQLSCLVDAH